MFCSIQIHCDKKKKKSQRIKKDLFSQKVKYGIVWYLVSTHFGHILWSIYVGMKASIYAAIVLEFLVQPEKERGRQCREANACPRFLTFQTYFVIITCVKWIKYSEVENNCVSVFNNLKSTQSVRVMHTHSQDLANMITSLTCL